MAKRGAKPKPAALQLVDGTRRTTRHGSKDHVAKVANQSLEGFGELKKPRYLKSEAAKAWKMFIDPAIWLDGSRLGAAIRLCQLWQESQMAPMSFPAGKEAQLRAYFSDLGLTDERNRVQKPDSEKDEFFDD